MNTAVDNENNTEIKQKKALMVIIISIAAAVILYAGIGAVKYHGRFLPNTVINGTDFSGMSVEDVCSYYDNKLKNYKLNIYNKGYIIDIYEPDEIALELSYKAKWYFAGLVKKQSNFLWLPALMGKKDVYELNYMDIMCYNIHKLNNTIAHSVGYNLRATKQRRQGSIFYNGSEFTIVPPVASDQIEPATYIQCIYKAVQGLSPDMVIEESDCYVRNDMTPEIENKLKKACVTAKNFFDSADMNIRLKGYDYDFNRELINAVYNIDGSYNFICNEDTIERGIDAIGKRYNTMGIERSFNTSHGTTVSVKGGDYGCYIDTDTLKRAVKSALLNKEKVDKEIYFRKNILKDNTKDIGDTYIEIDLTNQYLYMYVNGKLVKDCPVVTGLPGSRATPQGVYMLKAKAMDVPLVGDNYVTPVKYWMPFNRGIGLHDAVWQSYFGGDTYKRKGSHGCVNLSMSSAKEIYGLALVNMPVVCYYHSRIDAFKPLKSPDPVMGQYRALTASERATRSRILRRR